MNTAGDQGGHGIIAVAEACCYTCSERDDIFQRSAEFNTENIGAGVDAEIRRHENILNILGHLTALRGRDYRCRETQDDFFGMGRSGESADDGCRQKFLKDFRLSFERALLYAFCHCDDSLTRSDIFAHLFGGHSRKWRSHCHDDKFFIGECFLEIRCEIHRVRKNYIAEIRMNMCGSQIGSLFFERAPHKNIMSVCAQNA